MQKEKCKGSFNEALVRAIHRRVPEFKSLFVDHPTGELHAPHGFTNGKLFQDFQEARRQSGRHRKLELGW